MQRGLEFDFMGYKALQKTKKRYTKALFYVSVVGFEVETWKVANNN